jgi:sulfate permease, SulP family
MLKPVWNFQPRLFDLKKGYSQERFFKDIGAGLTVGVVALPLAMAFAIASGLKPEAGIFTAIIAGFIISAFSGSPVQIGGPAGAFIVIVYGIIERYGLANLLISTILAGILLLTMGFFRLGNLIRFIPITIITGFTTGIAVLIGLSQIKDFFGLSIQKVPADFFGQLTAIYNAKESFNVYALALAVLSLALIFLWPKSYKPSDKIWKKWFSKIPGTIVVLSIGVLLTSFTDLPVETIGSRFGGIPQGLPEFEIPVFSWLTVKQLFAPTLTIALLGAVESLLCARVADQLTNDRHDPNQELLAQGLANFITPFFGGMPATGTIARTVTNIRSGGSSPISGIVHTLVLLTVVLLAAPLAANIPLPSLAAILVFVAWNMGEWHAFTKLKNFSMNYRIVLVGTFLLTVIFDLTVAVEVGMVMACLFFIMRISSITRIEEINSPNEFKYKNIKAYQVYGSLFFGAVDKIEALFDPRNPDQVVPDVFILNLHQMVSLDTTGVEGLEGLYRSLEKHESLLILCEANQQPASLLHRSGFLAQAHVKLVKNLDEAWVLAQGHLNHRMMQIAR